MSDFQEEVCGETGDERASGPDVDVRDSGFDPGIFRGPGGGHPDAMDSLLGHWAIDDLAPVILTQRDLMLAEVEAHGSAELGQLDEKYAAEKADLERRFAGQLGGLETEEQTQLGGLATHVEAGDAKLTGEIGRRTKAHETQIGGEHDANTKIETKYTKANDGGNAEDVAKARTAAAFDADKTRGEANSQAAVLRLQGRKEADQARHAAGVKAAEARAAAAAYARKVPGSEVAGVTRDGEERAKQALAVGEREAKRITDRADTEATRIVMEGDRLAKVQLGRGESTATSIDKRGANADALIHDQTARADSEMQGFADRAEAGMARARNGASTETKALTERTSAKMDAVRAGTGTAAAKQKTDALAALEKTYQAQKAEIEKRTKAAAKKVTDAKEAELDKVKKKVDRDLASLDKLAEGADDQMKGQVRGADGKLAEGVKEAKRKLRREAALAKQKTDQIGAGAARKLASADAGTKKEIADAAKRGAKAIKGVGYDAVWDVAAENQEALGTMAEMALTDDETLTLVAQQGKDQVKGQAAKTGAAVESEWLDEAGQDATAIMKDGVAVMHTLSSLPPALQAKAVEKLSIDELHSFLDSIPEDRRENLGPLLANTHDPLRKLSIWAAFHRSESRHDALRHGRDERFSLNASSEVSEEVMAMVQAQISSGKAITEAQVQELIDRKELELSMEMRHGLVFTTEGGLRKNGTHINWTKKELETLEGTLNAVPEAHKAKNPKFTEMIREDVDTNNGYSAMHGGDNKIHVYDKGADTNTTSKAGTNVGDSRELVDRECPHCGMILTGLDMSIAHEMGHAVHSDDTKSYEKFKDITGWNELDADGMKKAGISQADIDKMEDARKNKVGWGSRPTVRKDGKIYLLDPYGKFLVVDDTAVPEMGEHINSQRDGETDYAWEYSRTSPKEHFAEIYSKAITVPEQLHQDLVTLPEKAVKDAKTAYDAATDPATKKKAKEKLDHATAAAKQRSKEYHLMRDEVFDADAEVDAAQARLSARGVTGDALKKFRAAADAASTPQQVRTIEKTF